MDEKTTLLRLMALDSEDLDVLAAHMQDAVVKVADLSYDARSQSFDIVANRFVWETAGSNRAKSFERRRAVMSFKRVSKVRSLGLRREDAEQVLELLTVQYLPETEGAAAEGVIELIFAGDISIRLDVECVEVQLADLGPAWETRRRPRHPERA